MPGERRRHGAPARGEWTDLPVLTEPVLPAADRSWGANARRAWNAWRRDSVTTQWTPADIHFARELCRRWDKLPPGEQRLRLDAIGCTPVGRRNLRWRSPVEVPPAAEKPVVRRLRLTERDDAQREN